MQLDFLWSKREEPLLPTVLELDATRTVPVMFRRNNRARRYLLRLRPDGSALVTVPWRGSLRQARLFLETHKAWLLQQVLRLQSRPAVSREWAAGTEFLFRGEPVRLALSDDRRHALFGTEKVAVHPSHSLRRQIEARLRRLAQRELPPRVVALARQHACAIARVSVRNQHSRWGSCSSRGTISLNWRLIQMPSPVRDYIILHELMHTREMNHSRRFWSQVEAVCPDYAAQERWLKTHGAGLGLR